MRECQARNFAMHESSEGKGHGGNAMQFCKFMDSSAAKQGSACHAYMTLDQQ